MSPFFFLLFFFPSTTFSIFFLSIHQQNIYHHHHHHHSSLSSNCFHRIFINKRLLHFISSQRDTHSIHYFNFIIPQPTTPRSSWYAISPNYKTNPSISLTLLQVLFKRKTVEPLRPTRYPPDDAQVWFIPATGEFFDEYEDYLNRYVSNLRPTSRFFLTLYQTRLL